MLCGLEWQEHRPWKRIHPLRPSVGRAGSCTPTWAKEKTLANQAKVAPVSRIVQRRWRACPHMGLSRRGLLPTRKLSKTSSWGGLGHLTLVSPLFFLFFCLSSPPLWKRITAQEKIFACFWMLIGVVIYSFLIGSISSLLSYANSQGEEEIRYK